MNDRAPKRHESLAVRIVRWTVPREVVDEQALIQTPARGFARPRARTLRAATTGALIFALTSCAESAWPETPPTGETVAVHVDVGEALFARTLVVPSPIPSPEDKAGRGSVEVRLSLADGSLIDVDDAGRLILPRGARIDRVERAHLRSGARPIADVRGARVDDTGQLTFHVLRPDGPRAPALFGASFRALDDEAQRRAHADVAAAMQDGRGFARAFTDDEKRARAVRHFVSLGACNACHAPLKPEATRVDARLADGTLEVHRATGAQGFYALDALFRDDGPVEDHKPVQPALASRFMRFTCGDDVVAAPARPACDDGRVLRAHLDVRRALAEGDAHARGVCDARVALAARMTDRARDAVAPALRVCE